MPKLKEILKARFLRRAETEQEKILWKELRNNKLGIKFRRQHPLDVFVLDFYAPEIKLAIELDGSVHQKEDQRIYDTDREKFLKSKGVEILRFWNSEVEKDIDEVLNKIKQKIVSWS
jgi:very-short-patch-repair endonuclease